MNRHFKILILLLCILCSASLFATVAFADETIAGIAEVAEQNSRIPVSFELIQGVSCKTEYTEGEEFSTENLFGKVTYHDGSSEFLYPEDLVYLQTGPLTTDITSITFVVGNLTYDLPITVTPSAVPIVSVIGFEIETTKTEYLALEKIDPSAFSAKLLYSDGTEEPVDISLCTFHPSLETPISAYDKTISVSYSVGNSSYSDFVNVTVSPILLADIEGIENISLYEATTPSIPEGLKVTAYYNGYKTISQVITDFEISYDSEFVKADENGKTKLEIILDSKTVEVEVNVLPIVGYNVTGLNSVYYYGDSFSYADARVYASYSDGTSVNVTSQVVFNGPEIITKGSEITAFHNGFDLKDFLKVSLPEGKLTIIQAPTKTNYEIGEIFDSAGLLVGIDYADGHRVFLTSADYALSVSIPLTAADKFVTVSYLNIEEKIYISVGDEAYITSLKIIGSPDVLTYYEGSLLNTSGLNIEATFSDGTTAIVAPSALTFSPALNEPLTADIALVKISANDGTDKYCETTLPITVVKKVPTALAPTAPPNKLVYTEGEAFDPDGLQLQLFFNDGSSIVPSSYGFSPELGSAIVLRSNATEKFIIYAVCEYDGAEFAYPIEITVTPVDVESLLVSRQPIKTVYNVGEEFDPTGLELILTYKDRTLSYPKVPEGYYTYSPSVITAETKAITISFRGLSVDLPITVNGVDSSEDTTTPIDSPITTDPIGPDTSEPDVTTEDPNVTTDTDVTTEESSDTTEPEDTPGSTDVTTSPDKITTEGDSTTEDNSGGTEKNPSSLLYLWIIIIVIIIAALIALIIYYKKNFT